MMTMCHLYVLLLRRAGVRYHLSVNARTSFIAIQLALVQNHTHARAHTHAHTHTRAHTHTHTHTHIYRLNGMSLTTATVVHSQLIKNTFQIQTPISSSSSGSSSSSSSCSSSSTQTALSAGRLCKWVKVHTI
jgi:hypothetical protein